jgi:hypothetical protein
MKRIKMCRRMMKDEMWIFLGMVMGMITVILWAGYGG